MELLFQVKMNPKLFLKDPEESALGKKIIAYSIELISESGLEQFTFKKLAQEIGTTEASIYRYFENKHRLLIYIVEWYWTWLEYRILFTTNNIQQPSLAIQQIIRLLALPLEVDPVFSHINKEKLKNMVVMEGSKVYLTRQVVKDNEDQLFKPYKDLCKRIADIFSSYSPPYPFPRSLASTLLEMANYQSYFRKHLPSLTDFPSDEQQHQLVDFLEHLVFSSLDALRESPSEKL
jgi:AcrR family transcriptional regulator